MTDLGHLWQNRRVRGLLVVLVAVMLVLDMGLEGHPYFAFQTLPFFDVLLGIGASFGGFAVAYVCYVFLWRARVYEDD